MSVGSWRHAICRACWAARLHERDPSRLLPAYADLEQCCYCGAPTREGFYVRDDPAIVHPTLTLAPPQKEKP